MHNIKCIATLILFVVINTSIFGQGAKEKNDRKNILLIVVDDLKPQLGCYGYNKMRTPNIDALAKEAVLFKRAYCQIASCGPSRASFLTSQSPDQTQIFDNVPYIRDHLPYITTLPQQFKDHGYRTLSFGKIFHGIFEREVRDDPISWSESPWRPKAAQYYTDQGLNEIRKRHPQFIEEAGGVYEAMAQKRLKGLAWESPDLPDSMFVDGKIANKAVSAIRRESKGESPFFIAVGFTKPHLPFVAPKKYFELYKDYDIEDVIDEELPLGFASLSHNNSREMRGYSGVPVEGNISTHTALSLTKAYNACVSFIDFQIGKLIEGLEKSGVMDKTVIVLLGDHGYHLGDLGLWCKNTNFESAVRVPLIISSPDGRSAGRTSNELVELLDLMPTVCELGNVPIPSSAEGISLVPVLNDSTIQERQYAISQGPRPYFGKDKRSYMGYSIRSDQFRYTEWIPKDKAKPVVRELYDFEKFDKEKYNIADDPRYSKVVNEMSNVLNRNITN